MTGAQPEFAGDLSRASEVDPPLPALALEMAPGAESPAAGRDLTGTFNSVWNKTAGMPGEGELTELRKYNVLLVRGFMTGVYVTPVDIFGKKVMVGNYFNDQMEVLAALGVDYKMVEVDSVMPPAHNARIVAKEIEASAKPVLIISHSDGGMYVLEALVENKNLLPKVHGFISLQSPFFGSPVADYIEGHGPLLGAMTRLLSRFGGTVDSLASLSTVARNGFQSTNRGTIAGIVSKVRIISFASWKDKDENKRLDTMLALTRNFMLKLSLASDGLVPLNSAVLPGSDYVEVSGVDHIVSVMKNDSVLKYDRARMTKSLLLMVISK